MDVFRDLLKVACINDKCCNCFRQFWCFTCILAYTTRFLNAFAKLLFDVKILNYAFIVNFSTTFLLLNKVKIFHNAQPKEKEDFLTYKNITFKPCCSQIAYTEDLHLLAESTCFYSESDKAIHNSLL